MGKQIHFYIDDETEQRIIKKLRNAGCVFAEEEARLFISEAPTLNDLSAMVEQRAAGFPVEHVIGWADFCGIRIAVDPGVFIPRRRTEFLVQQAAALTVSGALVVDLCCGTGAIGVALAKALGWIELYAIDIDPASVRCARRNVSSIGGHVYEGDLFKPLPEKLRGCIHILVINAPYVPTEALDLLPREARMHEALIALDGGKDGLDVYRRVAAEAPLWLSPGGHVLAEINRRQGLQSVEIFAQNGLIPQVINCDDLDSTIIIGTKTR